mgnify:CR=1 FL=1
MADHDALTLIRECTLGTYVVMTRDGRIVGRIPLDVLRFHCDLGGHDAKAGEATTTEGPGDDRQDR